MKLSDYITLLKAGYTRKDIDAILEEEKTEPAPAPEDKPEPVQEPKPVENPVDNGENQAGNAEILTAIKDLTAAIQASNIRNDQIPENEKTGEDVLYKLVHGKE